MGSSGQHDKICNSRLPRGLDPHSIPSEELAASLGYMVQLLNLVIHNVAAPALHNSGFAVSLDAPPHTCQNFPCARVLAPVYGNETVTGMPGRLPEAMNIHYFIPRQNSFSTGGETSWSDRSSSNFGVASMMLLLGHLLLKHFGRLLATLSSSKEGRSVSSSKMACSRSSKQVQKLNKSAWNVNSALSSSTLLESAHTLPITALLLHSNRRSPPPCKDGIQQRDGVSRWGDYETLYTSHTHQHRIVAPHSLKLHVYGPRNTFDSNLPSSVACYLYATEPSDIGKSENLIEGWDIVEHLTLPPPPSQTEDVEHWTRAMFIDATKK
ncbi:DNA-directed RNA polymerase II protein [Actinidia rufa]|uniref:DNA-directed RNA polymerase II protein n=1 Tax=Actinidia rufa TaxID=165716 RepID=A0A7J0FCT1_9ERIC|nr:DNA-directed RNA polymerase II protein [Actinidia rufa]